MVIALFVYHIAMLWTGGFGTDTRIPNSAAYASQKLEGTIGIAKNIVEM